MSNGPSTAPGIATSTQAWRWWPDGSLPPAEEDRSSRGFRREPGDELPLDVTPQIDFDVVQHFAMLADHARIAAAAAALRSARRSLANRLGIVPEWKPGRNSRARVSPCEPTSTGCKFFGPIGREQPPVLFQFPDQEAEDAGRAE